MKVAVITPTIGTDHLRECIRSVQTQDYDNITHYIFIDGNQYKNGVQDTIFIEKGDKNISTIILEENIGKGWYGHRVYAASSFLVNADVLCYLDEDNWIEPDHISSLIKVLPQGVPWAYSFRKIFDKDGSFICEDNCESLGHWPIYFSHNDCHIDTSCYAVRREVAIRLGHSWYGQWGADRNFFSALRTYYPTFKCSGKHSLCYRLDGNPNSVTKDFFINGNELNLNRYKNLKHKDFPWKVKE